MKIKKILSWCLAFAMILSLCTFNVAHAAGVWIQETVAGSDYVTLSWTSDPSDVYYHVNVNGAQAWEGFDSTYTITGLTPNTTYSLEVWSQDHINGWAWLATTGDFSVTTAAEAGDEPEEPEVVDTLTATDVGENYITIAWPDSYGGVHYKVILNDAMWDISDGLRTYTFNDLNPNTTYKVGVLALNENWQWVGNQHTIDVKTAESATPYVEILNRTSSSLTIKMYNVDEEGTYYISSVTGDGETALEETEFTGSVFEDTDLAPATEYTYTIYPADESFADLIVTGTTMPEYKIEVTDVTDKTVTLSWVKKEGAVANKLLIKALTSGAVVPAPYHEYTDIYDVTSFTVKGLTPSSLYEFEVVPLNASWNWLPSYKIQAQTTESEAAYAGITERTSSKLVVELFNADEEGTYYITATKADGTVVLDNKEFTGIRYEHTDLESNTEYSYTITDAAGTLNVTAEGKTKPNYSISATELTETSVKLDWVAVEDTAGYKIQITSSDGGAVPQQYDPNNDNFGHDAGNVQSHTVTGLESNHQYTIKVISMANGSWSWQYTYNVDITTLANVDAFVAIRQGVNDITLRWPAVEDAAYYNVYRIENGEEVLAGENIDPIERTFQDVWLKHNTEYTYVLRAFDGDDGEIEFDNFVNTLTAKTEDNTRWNNDLGDEYYAGGALATQNIRHETYYSELMGLEVGYNIHIPANYNPEDTETRYPVLYFLHPLGGNENSWVSDYWGATYVETLQGTGDNMFIVYVNNAGDQWYTDAANGLYYGRSTVLYELIPHIDATYNTIATKRGRALDGFSMGGVGSLLLAFERPDMFNSIVTNSAAVSNALDDFISMNWGTQNTVFGRDVNVAAAENYYDQEGIYAVYEKNKDKIEEYGLNIIMRWGEIDPVALISNQKMYDLLSKNPGINISNEIIPGYDHSGVYYDGRMWSNLDFHKRNLDFSGTAQATKEYKIGSVNVALGDVFIEQGSTVLPDDAKLLVAAYDEEGKMISCETVDVEEGIKTDFEPVTDASYVKVYIWGMEGITPVTESKIEVIF